MSSNFLISNISQLLTIGSSNKPKRGRELRNLGIIKNAFLHIKNGRISAVGSMSKFRNHKLSKKTPIIDAKNQVVMPGLIDCHTHLVFAGERSHEFFQKIQGTKYLEILKKGGGILDTVKKTRLASKKRLTETALKFLQEMIHCGTTTIEAKSGYGLNLETEIKILQVLKNLNQLQEIEIVPTFLAAHTRPPEFKKNRDYLTYLLQKVAPLALKYAEFADIFCEKKVFNKKESRDYLTACRQLGFQLKIHADQLSNSGVAAIATELNAVSADHLDYISETTIKNLAAAVTIAVLLPGVSLHLSNKKLPPARKMIDSGVAIALASDFNPGSCPTFNLFLIMYLACRLFKLSPEEAINAVTINAAHALQKGHEIGSIEADKIANILILKCHDYHEIPYWIGRNLVKTIIISNHGKTKVINVNS